MTTAPRRARHAHAPSPGVRVALAVMIAVSAHGCRSQAPEPAVVTPPTASEATPVPDPVVGRCGLAEGDVQIARGPEPWAPIVAGEELRAGDRVLTGKLGSVRLDFAAGVGVRLSGEAELGLGAAALGGDDAPVLLSVISGVARAFVEPGAEGIHLEAPGGSRVRVEPRGEHTAQLRLTRSAEGLEVAVTRGEAALIASGIEKTLTAGQHAEVVQGELGPVEEMLRAPALASPGPDERFLAPGLILRLAWAPVPAARGYRIEIARDAGFQSLVRVVETEAAHTLFVPREAGVRFWRVAARDPRGRLGRASEPRTLFLEAEPPVEHLQAPADGAVFRYYDEAPRVSLRWSPVPGAPGYRVVLARGGDLHGADVRVETTSGTMLELERIADGEYHWGVYLDGALAQPLFLEPRRFRLRRAAVKIPTTLENWGR